MTERAILLIALAACGGSSNAPTPDAPDAPDAVTVVALTIEVQGSSTSYVGGPQIHLAANAEYSDQSRADVTDQATWSASPGVVISEPGVVVPVVPGVATVSASLEDVDATVDVRVAEGALVVISTANALGPINVYEPHVEGEAPILRTFRSTVSSLAPCGIAIVDDEIIIASRDDIQVFDQDTDGAFLPAGAATPKRRIAGPASQVRQTSSLAVRGAEIFTANGRILVHAIEADGQSPPLRYIAGTGRSYQHVQVVGSELFAASVSGHIDVYDAAASGEPTPIRTLDTGTSDITELHATATELFVGHPGNVLRVYALQASGAAAPLRTLETPESPRRPRVIGGELYVLQPVEGSYLVYETGASGTAAPIRKVTGVGPGTALEVH